jgi:hypothetical protein
LGGKRQIGEQGETSFFLRRRGRNRLESLHGIAI